MTEKAAGLAAAPPVVVAARPLIAVDTASVTKKTSRRTTGPRETVLQGLVRILGSEVRDIIPTDVQEAVEAAYTFWNEHSDSYLVTRFDSEADKLDAVIVMKAYAEIAPNGPYTIRVDHDSPAKVLHWRAQTRQGRNTDSE